MKFLCDRCKTRYSIGDDRVRGKILKIRCKNCANVITVREGMQADAEAAAAHEAATVPAGARRAHTQTTAAPAVQSEAPAGGALGAAFTSELAKPPPALEEEWYVSIDGDQAGPFSLVDAQRWIGSKSLDADLHCWSEGFDDWLPVDKVSHFRGLRKKPAPPAPVAAALPRVGSGPYASANSGPVRAALAPRIEMDSEATPKPLFAATMASLEKGGPASAPLPLPAVTKAAIGASGGASGSVSAPLPAPLPLAAPIAPTPMPHTNGRALVAPLAAPVPVPEPAPLPEPAPAAPVASDDEDDDLHIGEVSRVVNLADLMRSAQPQPQPNRDRSQPVKRTGPIHQTQGVKRSGLGHTTGAVGRMSQPRLGTSQMAAVEPIDPATGAPLTTDGAAVEVVPLPQVSHKRGVVVLVLGALALIGAAVAVLFAVSGGEEDSASGRVRISNIDTTRPDDPSRNLPPGPGSAVGSAAANPLIPTRRPTGSGTTRPTQRDPVLVPQPTGDSLRPDEIEDMAAKYSSTTQRCYMRAQRGEAAILVGDVKKISVTLTVGNDGVVSEVALSDNQAQNSLGKCLISAIRSWKFRTSPGGTFRFVLHFG